MDFDFTNPNTAMLLNLGGGLLAAGGPSSRPTNLGQAFGAAMPGAIQAQMQASEAERARQMQAMQIAEHLQKQEAAKARAKAMAEYGAGLENPQDQARFRIDPEGYFKSFDEANKPLIVAPENTVLKGGKVTFTAPKTQKLPEGMELGADGRPAYIPAYIAGKKEIARAGKTDINNTVAFPKEQFKNERDLRNDYQNLPTTKAFKEVQTSYDQISTALSNPSPANDLVAATKFMKLLDPGSVVRESELGMAMAATGVADRVQNYAQMILSGHKLTPEQRKDFSASASELFKAAQNRQNETAEEYRTMAKEYGLNPDRITKVSSEKAKSRFIDIGGKKIAAQLGTDGNYYVLQNGKKYRVEED